ncbi:asparaginase domain-containing protein [Actinoallomurus sp. NBC_01490]|uniref:asparaginase domain-containing protein n=1 Tax=Actinoallomurus sp. NBC_01490 TaxID=2903557 RepID=UPI002E33C81C|nr:asparaginase domain-containing protein [Actinoallomurus sp. NBC_01490]
MTLSPGPPPWPIPPSWTVTPPRRATATTDTLPPDTGTAPPPVSAPVPASAPAPVEQGVPRQAIVLLAPDDAAARDVVGAVPGVTVEARTLPAPAVDFAGVYALADAVARAFAEGAEGVVVVDGGDTPDETAWALDLLHAGDAPLVLAAGPGGAVDVADAVNVAAAAPAGSGCLAVAHGEVHAARYVRRTGAHELSSPGAGPLGRVTAGSVRLRWRPPERLTVRDVPTGDRTPRVGLHTAVLGDDGELPAALAERCDGLVVAGGAPDPVVRALATAASRIPVVLASATGHDAFTTTSLDPRKARVLMHLLLATGRDRDAVLAAFVAAERPGQARL